MVHIVSITFQTVNSSFLLLLKNTFFYPYPPQINCWRNICQRRTEGEQEIKTTLVGMLKANKEELSRRQRKYRTMAKLSQK
jgi:hypothetical protein